MTAARRALRGAAGMTARSRSLERMVRRYVLGCGSRQLEAKTVTRGAPTNPLEAAKNRRGPACPAGDTAKDSE